MQSALPAPLKQTWARRRNRKMQKKSLVFDMRNSSHLSTYLTIPCVLMLLYYLCRNMGSRRRRGARRYDQTFARSQASVYWQRPLCAHFLPERYVPSAPSHLNTRTYIQREIVCFSACMSHLASLHNISCAPSLDSRKRTFSLTGCIHRFGHVH